VKRLLAQLFPRTDDGDQFQVSKTNIELISPFASFNHLTPDIPSTKADPPGTVRNKLEPAVQNPANLVFSLYLELPDSDIPSSLICPRATIADAWISRLSGSRWNTADTEVFNCMCNDIKGRIHHGDITGFRGRSHNYLTLHIDTNEDTSRL
jgi:hypothetical protein